MIIQCRKCKRAMELWEFLTYVEAFFMKIIVSEAAVSFIMLAIKNQFSKKGIIDSHMVGLANNFKIACPHCKKHVCWDSASEIKAKALNQKGESEACN